MQQVNVAGVVEPLTDVESDQMWTSRGPAGQAVSLASAQGEILADEAELAARTAAMAGSHALLSRPIQHAGLLLEPLTVEFWDGRTNRLHWRMHYERTPSGWVQWRLQP
jgi:pyridoxamine 5'-phosphate oxidase